MKTRRSSTQITILMAVFLLLGLAVLWVAYHQNTIPATVTEMGEVTYTRGVNRGRTHRKSKYSVDLTVVYTDEAGEEQHTRVRFVTHHQKDLPKVGGQVDIVKTLNGMTPYPNRTLRTLGGTLAAVNGFSLFTKLVVRASLKRDEKRTRQKREEEDAWNGTK